MTDVATDAPPVRRLTLVRLDERLHVLEHPQPKSLAERIKESAGVLALAISIVTGGFTIVDSLWIGPGRERETHRSEKVARLRSEIQQMSAINQSAGQAIAATVDPSEKIRINLTALGQKRTLLQDAMALETEAGNALSTNDYLVLAAETMTVANIARALDYAAKGAARATNGFEREEALRNKAIVEFISNQVDQGRRDYAAALRAVPQPEFAAQRANVLGTWAYSEANRGNCAAVPPLLARFMAAVNHPAVDATTRTTFIGMLKQQLLSLRQCREGQIDLSALA